MRGYGPRDQSWVYLKEPPPPSCGLCGAPNQTVAGVVVCATCDNLVNWPRVQDGRA